MMKPNVKCTVKCANPICGNRMAHNRTVSYFTFPKDPVRCAVWIKHCCLTVPMATVIKKQYKLCGKHFETKFFLNDFHNRLQYNAIPTLFPNNMPYSLFQQLTYEDYDESSMDSDIPDQPLDLETPVPISNVAHNDHDYQKQSDLMKLTNKAAPSIVISLDNDKQKEDVTMKSDLKASQIPGNKCYDELTDHTYAKFTKSSPFKAISTEKCIDPPTYIQTSSEGKKVIDEQCVLDPSKSNKPENIPSSKYIKNNCMEIIESIENPSEKDWKEISLAQSNVINDLRKEVKGLQRIIKKNNLELEKFSFFKLHYQVSQLNKTSKEMAINIRNAKR